jgi:hypothetical protein
MTWRVPTNPTKSPSRCRRRTEGQILSPLQFLRSGEDEELFEALSSGEFNISGFQNNDLPAVSMAKTRAKLAFDETTT